MTLALLKAQKNNKVCKPLFFDLNNSKQKLKLEKLIRSSSGLVIHDEIESQLRELIKLRYPKRKLSDKELKKLIAIHVGGQTRQNYGVWVFYPWLNKLIHLLPKDEFIEVRTNRNHYKITPEEEAFLVQKKIGIIGLSVGKSIALTIALERICGELILADFDEIELSNLNRIQTGVQNFGVKKTVVVAREIAEIDPFLKVSCLHDGLTEHNVDAFFLNGGKLDVCIEVSDGLFTKIFARQKAKEYGIPVVMNSSDKGTTDIERYDLNPNLPILHGLIDHLDLTLLKEAKTNEEKVPYLLPMLGVETASNRLKASMLEIQETITTWPQLASGVVFGGGICTDVCRRLLLGELKNSGRYFVDIEACINDAIESSTTQENNKVEQYSELKETTFSDYEKHISTYHLADAKEASFLHLKEDEVKELVNAAIFAPSGGNIQPWKWIYNKGKLFLFNDLNRTTSILNFNNNANLISFGAATENLLLKAKERKLAVEFNKLPYDKNAVLIAVFYFYPKARQPKDVLVDYIAVRATNRSLGKRKPLVEAQFKALKESVFPIEGASLKLIKNKKELTKIQSILVELDRVYLTSTNGHLNFINEIRWNNQENELKRDGIDIETIELTATEKAGLVVAKKQEVIAYSKQWNLGNTLGKLTYKAIDSCSALGMLVLPKQLEHRFFDGGRALERMWLTAAQNNIGIQPISINSFLFERIEQQDFSGIEELEEPLKKLAKQLYTICELKETAQNVFFFRILNGHEPKIKSLRRKIEQVLIYD